MNQNLDPEYPAVQGRRKGLAPISPPDNSLHGMIERFEALHRRTDSPVPTIRKLPAREARWVDFPKAIDDRLREALASKGIETLYSHQAQSWDRIASGKHAVIVTPTASGKTLCYNLPVLNALASDPSACALYLFPTKALAVDQLEEFNSLGAALGSDIRAFTYDGDTPSDARRAIRRRANVVLSNPDMLHSGVLPHHTRWARFFEHLQYVIIDELHAYRGVFGSHLANVLRRLKRIAAFYGSNPQFICCSATIANPKELAQSLCEEQFELVDDNGAPRGEKFFVFYNPAVVNAQLGIRRSYVNEARRLAESFLERGRQTLVFANSRLVTEILTRYLKESVGRPPGGVAAVRGYRGGYLPRERREIERQLRDGEVHGVVATNALELGIDIGSLDAVVLAGYPGSIASTWQRAGRAGRRSAASVTVLVASSAPLDQYVIEHPEYFFDGSPEHAHVNPDNLEILVSHLKCAAFELPIHEDERFGPHDTGEMCAFLEETGVLHHAGGAWHWTSEAYPADAISLRKVTSDNFVVIDISGGSRVIGEVAFRPLLRHCTKRRSIFTRASCSTWTVWTLRNARRTSAGSSAATIRMRSNTPRSSGLRVSMMTLSELRWQATAKSASQAESSVSRRFAFTAMRMSATASSQCRSRRCTPQRSGFCSRRLRSLPCPTRRPRPAMDSWGSGTCCARSGQCS